MPELFAGEQIVNRNRSANMKKVSFYVCPICGNIIQAAGEGVYSCCGVQFPLLEVEETGLGCADGKAVSGTGGAGEVYQTRQWNALSVLQPAWFVQ